ncbi:MAG: endonuclease domain-containing protein [Hyphomicrobiales bacterium]|nr:MAG: endonuclease domain-containing protein [Hyphomicrobiales bacterium]
MRAPDFIRDRAKQLRHGMTLAERLLWIMLRRNARGMHFRRQHPVGPFILDFYCAEARLCIEIDGPVHDEADRIGRDLRRSAWLEKEGIRILRFTPAEVEFRPAYVLATITQATTGS